MTHFILSGLGGALAPHEIPIVLQTYLPSVNENPLDCVKKGVTPEEVDIKRDERIRYLAGLSEAQEPFSEADQLTLDEIHYVQSRALCGNRFTVASGAGIVLSGLFAAASCASVYFAAQALNASVGYAMFFAGTANALGNLIMYRDSRNQSRAADLKQDLHRKLCEEYLILSKRLLEHYYVHFADTTVKAEWMDVARRIEVKSRVVLARFEEIFSEGDLDASEIIAPLFDAAHHIAAGAGLYRSDLRDFIHTWKMSTITTPLPDISLMLSLTSSDERPGIDLTLVGGEAPIFVPEEGFLALEKKS